MKHTSLHTKGRYHLIKHLDIVVTIIYDNIDQRKTASFKYTSNSKTSEYLARLFISVMDMIVYGHGDVKFAHCSLDLYPANLNQLVGSFAKLLRNL